MQHIYSRRTKTAYNKSLDVFDFKEETEGSEFAPRFKSKLENPKNAIDKYTFLTTAAAGKNVSDEEVKYVPTLNIDAININHAPTTLVEDSSAKLMADQNDEFIVAENISESSPELKTDLSESTVNVAATSASPVLVEDSAITIPDSNDTFVAEQLNESSQELKTDLSESTVNVAATSASPVLVEDSARIIFDSNDTFVAEQLHESSPELKTDLYESTVNVAATSASPILDLSPSLPETDEVVEMDTDENLSVSERSSSSCDNAEDDGVGPSSDLNIGGWESDNEEKVVFYPEYMMYRDIHYTDPVISFTKDFIEFEGSTADDNNDDQTFKCKWNIEDILHISSHWLQHLELVKIHVLTKDTIHAETVECASGSELKCAVIASSWYGRLEEITSLNVEYRALWTNMFQLEDTALGVPFSKHFPVFDQPFEEVVYPKGDVDAVSLSKRDFDLLQPETFVNDTIIDFYIKYLKNTLDPEERKRFHFFNSFFFRKLADPDKDPLDASQGKIAYQRVRKWTRKVNIFEKDFVLIPVNYNYHWSLIVFCHLGETATYKDEDVNESIKVPCVLHMDSIRGSHHGLKGLLQSYLKEEWIGRQQVVSEDICSRFDNLRFISLELPQQPNSYDCGLFLLHYVELFLEQAPVHFNPYKLTNSSNFLNLDWFQPVEASLKRVIIQRLICDLLENPNSSRGSEQCHISIPTTNINEGSNVNLPTEDCNPLIPHQNSNEFGSFLTSSVQCGDDFTIASKSTVDSGSFLGTPFPDFNQSTNFDEYKGSLTPIQEDVEVGGAFVYLETESGIQENNNIINNNNPYDFGTQEPWQEAVNNKNLESSLEEVSTTCGYEDSIQLVNEKSQLDETKSAVLDALSEYVGGEENCLGLESDVQPPTKKMRVEV